MKTEPRDPLLAAVLLDDDAFRASTLRETLALAGRRRRWRLARRTLGAVSVLCAGVFLVLRSPTPMPPGASAKFAPITKIVRSAPAATLQTVHTQERFFAAVTSAPGDLKIVSSRRGAVVVIETRAETPSIDYLTDQQLFAAFPGRRPALIAPGTADARIVFY
jgi:hypothetical protein